LCEISRVYYFIGEINKTVSRILLGWVLFLVAKTSRANEKEFRATESWIRTEENCFPWREKTVGESE